MHTYHEHHSMSSQTAWHVTRILLTVAFVLALVLWFAQSAHGQTYTILHNFTNGPDGSFPVATLTVDAAGNLYGTTCGSSCTGSGNSAGTVFELLKSGSGWTFTTLYEFQGGVDGSVPGSPVIFGRDGGLYGTTQWGGRGTGTVFRLTPPPNALGNWRKSMLYSFYGADGYSPWGDLVFDGAGNLYGTTIQGGDSLAGNVFRLRPSSGGWQEDVLYMFTGGDDGAYPYSGVVMDAYGNLYGTASQGGSGYGTVFEVTSQGEQTLYTFQGGSNGAYPYGGVLLQGGNVIVTTTMQGAGGGGTAMMINNSCCFYSFSGTSDYWNGPWSTLTGSSNFTHVIVYGTTYGDGRYLLGSVFTMLPDGCAPPWGWSYASLWDFWNAQESGANPVGGVVFGPDGNMYGTTSQGGAYGYGVVFELSWDSNEAYDASVCSPTQ